MFGDAGSYGDGECTEREFMKGDEAIVTARHRTP